MENEPELLCRNFDKIVGMLYELKQSDQVTCENVDKILVELHVLEASVRSLRLWAYEQKVDNEGSVGVSANDLLRRVYKTQQAVRRFHYKN